MVLALIAPELTVTWATIQFLSARDTAKTFQESDVFGVQLYQAHSKHPDMGKSTTTLLLSEILTSHSDGRNSPHPNVPHLAGRDFRKWTVTHGFFSWMGGFILCCDNKPRATLTPKELEYFADIEGRSKGDALSKGIAILQLGWFVLQLVARYIQHLPITLLEIDTLAIVSLACMVFCLWWKKPKDVRRPSFIHWKNKTKAPPTVLTYENINPAFSLDAWHDYLILLIYPLRSLMGTAVIISPWAVRARRIPSLGGYADDNRHDRNHVITLFLGCFSAIIYGGLHCLGWHYLFWGHTEQVLWRVASIVIASASVPLLLTFGAVILFEFAHDVWVVRLAVVITAFLYIATRITIIVLVMSSLRSLPPSAYDTVAWTNSTKSRDF
ncbi:uncharacterized protein EDB93DRAFT_1254416 [Suillus bovinus]|uniref:uncharacterized protein n=1 Tax=Suillus bovinus TaxID=48563 RepID=UPI001B8721FE|nr:uncharacterized protein EDB93DRAFT_1254416 [Suillus bovinus]KAG2134912.1 hypothetical protein EDB93DRAFT_1254416 [Suillus bovinus]